MKKRFIAGAVCPRCAAMDRLVMYQKDEKIIRECIECGFTDIQQFQNSREELKTRVNQVDPEPDDPEIQPVKILR